MACKSNAYSGDFPAKAMSTCHACHFLLYKAPLKAQTRETLALEDFERDTCLDPTLTEQQLHLEPAELCLHKQQGREGRRVHRQDAHPDRQEGCRAVR